MVHEIYLVIKCTPDWERPEQTTACAGARWQGCRSNRCQQPKDYLQLKAPLARESSCVKFSGVIGICAGESHADDLPCKCPGDFGRRVLPPRHFAPPLPARA